MVDSSLIESLLYQSEGTALDFKRDQYSFANANATDVQKSELLKDILAFANSWRQNEAYIVIGVEEVTGGRHIPIGTEDHFNDAQLQQFVNSKTNRKVELSYEVHPYKGKKIGVIKIPKQERPTYAIKRFGKVDKEVVYYRLGSSTTIAKPEDIARMGRDSVEDIAVPVMNIQFANHETRQELGDSIRLSSIVYAEPTVPLPDAKRKQNHGIYDFMQPTELVGLGLQINTDYWREKEEYIRLTKFFNPVAFLLKNQSGILAQNVRVEIGVNLSGSITVESEIPDEPEYEYEYRISSILHHNSYLLMQQKTQPIFSFFEHGEQLTITVPFGNIQPKSCVWTSQPFYIGSGEKKSLKLEAVIYADNLPTPQKSNLVINFDIENKGYLTVDQLMEMPI